MSKLTAVFFICISTWLLWSGLTVEVDSSFRPVHVHGLLAGLGLVSCLLVLWLSYRLKVLDNEGHPYHLVLRILAYLPWLCREVVLSNFAIARIILKPKIEVHSHLIRVPASQKTEIGRVIHANTITLTPGTVTLDLRDGYLLVHALTAEAGDPVQSAAVDRRICQLEGEA